MMKTLSITKTPIITTPTEIRKHALTRFSKRLSLTETWKHQILENPAITFENTCDTLLIAINQTEKSLWISIALPNPAETFPALNIRSRLFNLENKENLNKLKHFIQILADRFPKIVICTNKFKRDILPVHKNADIWIMNLENYRNQCLNSFSPDKPPAELLEDYEKSEDTIIKALIAQKLCDAAINSIEALHRASNLPS